MNNDPKVALSEAVSRITSALVERLGDPDVQSAIREAHYSMLTALPGASDRSAVTEVYVDHLIRAILTVVRPEIEGGIREIVGTILVIAEGDGA